MISRATTEALRTIGSAIGAGRIERRWTAEEFAERLGVTRTTLRKVERGDPGVASGTMIEALLLLDISIFDGDPASASFDRPRRALLPKRVRRRLPMVNDDF